MEWFSDRLFMQNLHAFEALFSSDRRLISSFDFISSASRVGRRVFKFDTYSFKRAISCRDCNRWTFNDSRDSTISSSFETASAVHVNLPSVALVQAEKATDTLKFWSTLSPSLLTHSSSSRFLFSGISSLVLLNGGGFFRGEVR